ncbi:GntR family transcriptional regulator [Ramlibacter sp.]|uniref:GntR family transcriptional regulator n=1 Tax=Ramlibacter sp. TaxID=1917967 RepID=UPI002D807A70|nr:GntR family transcriptional regulator [Ramlibacter sp.]
MPPELMDRPRPKPATRAKSAAPAARARGDAPSQNEQAYQLLKDALTTLAYKPGEYLNTASLMDELALGRTPINHALHRLANEGLVQIIPRKGVMVSPLSIDDALELIQVRVANEGLCARLAAAKSTKAEVEQIKDVARRFDEAVARRNLTEVMNLDRIFHEHIAAAARNQMLAEILKVLHARSQRFWALSLAAEGHLAEVQAEHAAIIDALGRNDPDAAAAAVQAHVLSFQQALLHRR